MNREEKIAHIREQKYFVRGDIAVFAVLCWTFGLASLTLMFLFGAGANFVRAMCLCFYKRDRFYDGGLQ